MSPSSSSTLSHICDSFWFACSWHISNPSHLTPGVLRSAHFVRSHCCPRPWVLSLGIQVPSKQLHRPSHSHWVDGQFGMVVVSHEYRCRHDNPIHMSHQNVHFGSGSFRYSEYKTLLILSTPSPSLHVFIGLFIMAGSSQRALTWHQTLLCRLAYTSRCMHSC